MAKHLLDAVKTAKSIRNGDYSSLRGKSFVTCDKMKKTNGRNRHVKKSRMDRLEESIAKLAEEMRAGFKQVNSRIDNLEKDINTRLDYIVEANNLKDNK